VSKHPKQNERYTIWGPQVVELLERMRVELGTWRDVSATGEVRLKQLRALRLGIHPNGKKRTTVSMTVIDRMITNSGVGRVSDFTWYTPDELIEMGLWAPIEKEEEC
jgi:hypothetical protein